MKTKFVIFTSQDDKAIAVRRKDVVAFDEDGKIYLRGMEKPFETTANFSTLKGVFNTNEDD